MIIFRVLIVFEAVIIVNSATESYFDWKTDMLGLHYKGQLNRTISGRHCQPWALHKPHGHPYHDLKTEGNFCRNPDYVYPGPWCYTMDPRIRWELCAIYKCGSFCSGGFFQCNNRECIIEYLQCNGEPDCSEGEDELNCEDKVKECREESSAVTYRGRLNRTITGKNCKPWTSKLKQMFGNNSYCRTTSFGIGGKGPLCFTENSDDTPELCDVPMCDSSRSESHFDQKYNCDMSQSTNQSTVQDRQDESLSCFCPCSAQVVRNTTDVNKMKRDIEQNLRINKQNTTLYRRTKSSAPDDRVSSISMGIVAVTILVCVMSFVVLLDCLPSPKDRRKAKG